jgi:TetR/AcrR family transcriptional regulator, mexCD-oprJ operon repressor
MPAKQTTHGGSSQSERRRRADAERSVTSILDAALEALASDSEASMAEIARRAGVVRATIYVHFPTRESLIDAVTERAIAEVTEVMATAEPDHGDPAEALHRVLTVGWRELGRFHALVRINTRRPQVELRRLHRPVHALLQPLIERGMKTGTFRSDVPVAWHLSMLLALIHAASGELQAKRLSAAEIESALLTTVLCALGEAPGSSVGKGESNGREGEPGAEVAKR